MEARVWDCHAATILWLVTEGICRSKVSRVRELPSRFTCPRSRRNPGATTPIDERPFALAAPHHEVREVLERPGVPVLLGAFSTDLGTFTVAIRFPPETLKRPRHLRPNCPLTILEGGHQWLHSPLVAGLAERHSRHHPHVPVYVLERGQPAVPRPGRRFYPAREPQRSEPTPAWT